jgi:uncharacterized protein
VLQAVICSLIFYGYGFGQFGRVGLWSSAQLATVIFLAQIPLSTVWLRYFRFGPAEWLWRTLTYGTSQPLRIEAGPPQLTHSAAR